MYQPKDGGLAKRKENVAPVAEPASSLIPNQVQLTGMPILLLFSVNI